MARKRTKAEITEEKMAMVPEPTPAFIKWALSFVDVHRITYKPFRNEKSTVGICSACGKISTYEKGEISPKRKVRCKTCNAEGKALRSDWTLRNPVPIERVTVEVIMLNRVKNRFIERHFQVVKELCYDKEESWVTEISRLFRFKSGTPNGRYFHLYNPWTGKNFWSRANLSFRPIVPMPGPVYRRNLRKEMFADTPYKYCGLEIMAGKENFMPFTWMDSYIEHPELEMMAKMGLTRLALEFKAVSFGESGRPWERLMISKQQFDQLRAVNGGRISLEWFQEANRLGRNMDTETVRYFQNNRLWVSRYDFILDRMTERQTMNYLRRQCKAMHKGPLDVTQTWEDYLAMASRLKKDVKNEMVYRPKDLQKAHDDAVKMSGGADIVLRAGEIEKKFPHVEEILRDIRDKYEFEGKHFAVVVPDTLEDIIREGQILGHCLDRSDIYFDRIERKESFIVFLRQTEDIEKPFYTMEIEPDGTTRQKRTIGDRQDKDFARAVSFIRSWQKEVKKRLSSEDMALADTSAKLREAEFKELREKQTKVWHGALAGKLLADVLEADLMIAAG